MTRLMIALAALALAACPASPKGGAAGSGGGAALPPKRLQLSWGIAQDGELADIYLATTDETGKQVSHQVGRYKGACAPFSPAKEAGALMGVRCAAGGGGTDLLAVHRGGEIIVVQQGTAPGAAPDPMAWQEVTRVAIPTGVAVEAAP